MRIVFTGGGTGGHFYPIIAVIEEIVSSSKIKNANDLKLYYFSTEITDAKVLKKYNVKFKKISSGKLRTYKSKRNIFDSIKVFFGIISAVWKLFLVYPDVVFGKGGYASFPTLVAARILAIPVVIHESDTVPGRVNKWAGKFAKRIAISWPEVVNQFPEGKVALTGQPIRKQLLSPSSEDAYKEFNFDPNLPVITILGGSQGAVRINDHILDVLPSLLEGSQIIHQTGVNNYDDVMARSRVVLEKNDFRNRYHAIAFLSQKQLSAMAKITSLVISRAGSIIFEIAIWGIPSILIPIPENVSRDQTKNAFAYARAGATSVIEEENLTPHLFIAEINKIMNSKETFENMKKASKEFSKADAAKIISDEILNIAISHE